MTNPTNPLPDLSSWYPVPVWATIPAGAKYAYVDAEGDYGLYERRMPFLVEPHCAWTYYTQECILAPLPAKEGAEIIAELVGWPARYVLTRSGSAWRAPNGSLFQPGDIIRWALAPTEWHER